MIISWALPKKDPSEHVHRVTNQCWVLQLVHFHKLLDVLGHCGIIMNRVVRRVAMITQILVFVNHVCIPPQMHIVRTSA